MRRRSWQPVLAEIAERRPGSRPGSLSRSELEAFSALEEALAGAGAVLATGPAGSAVALGLAAVGTVGGRRVVLVECDLAEPVLADTLGIPSAPGLHEYLSGEAEPAQILQPLVPAGPASGAAADHLACIVAGSPSPAAAPLLASDRCRHAVAMLRSAYDRVVLDGPPLGAEQTSLEALAGDAEAVIVCGRREELPRRPPLAGAELVLVR